MSAMNGTIIMGIVATLIALFIMSKLNVVEASA